MTRIALASLVALTVAACGRPPGDFATGALIGGGLGAAGGAIIGAAVSRPAPPPAPVVVYEQPREVVYEPRPYYVRRGWGYGRGW
jgi:hypothetical protein